ncbi:MAG TPA: S53 family peptidase [Streptosporangiaceae bacterium]|nr:S53 family peptidase [Streptosporangiaceae bacterium]
MRKITGVVAAAALLTGLAVASASAAPAPPVRLAGSGVPFTRSLASTGAVPGTQRLTIQVWLAPRDPAGAARYATTVSTPGRTLFHRFLSPDAYTARFGGTAAEAGAISGWLRGAGFTGVAAGTQRSYIQATAPVTVIDAALHTRLRYYRATRQINAGSFRLRANDRAIRVPAALATSVLAVTGLDNEAPDLPLAGASRVRPASPAASKKIPCSHYYGQHRLGHLPREFGATSFPTSICGYTPWQLRRIYGANRPDDGQGQTIALVELGLTRDMFLTLKDYARAGGLPAPSRSRYAELDLGKRSCSDAFNGEEQLDVESAYDMALGIHELVIGGNTCSGGPLQNLYDALLKVLGGTGRHPLASIVSNSWENPFRETAAQTRLSHSILVRAAAEGVGMYFSTNDRAGVLSPSDDPFATAVGGTSLGISRTGSRVFETGWSTGWTYIRKHHWLRPMETFAGGGGPSPRWAEPSYQKGIVPPTLSRHGASRSIPDLSALADANTGFKLGMLVFSRQSPPRYTTVITGGTSLATPLVAALVADAQQGRQPFGYLNPVFYRLAGTAAFHDVLPETSRSPARFRAVACATANGLCNIGQNPALGIFDEQNPGRSYTGQVTLKGYDNMTGLGSPNGRAFITALRRLEP